MSHHDTRKTYNEKSKNTAEHDREPWSAEETDNLMEMFPDVVGDHEEEKALAELLGRTIEACRERYYKTRRGQTRVSVKTTTTTTTTTEYLGLFDDEEDIWWK